MRVRLLFAACALFAAGGAVAQVMNHDLPVQAIMATGVNPGALAFWAGGNDPPENETPAQAAARWDAALKGAQVMQAKGVELQKHSRPGRWNAFAQMMADVAKEGEAAAKAKDAEKAFEIGGRLYDSCNGCHKTYIPTPPRPQ
jgi:cytochrome c556